MSEKDEKKTFWQKYKWLILGPIIGVIIIAILVILIKYRRELKRRKYYKGGEQYRVDKFNTLLKDYNRDEAIGRERYDIDDEY